jgi:tetratricopeptide (TPR) repeat protein
MKKLVMSIVFVLGATFAFGQELTKEELKQQKKEIKTLVNIAKDAELNLQTDPAAAVNAMKPVISNPLVKTNPFVWYVSASAKKAVIDAENRKRAEGAPFNESMLYSYTYELGHELENCEKYDNAPDAKGKIAPKYSEFIITTYAQEFGQFYNAGAYFYGNEDYTKSYDLFKMFIDAADKLYKAGMMEEDKVNVPVAAYNMTLSAMQLQDYEKVLTHVDLAMANEQMAPSAFRYKAVAHLELGDTATWLNDCMEGAKLFPDDAYFYQSLIQYYDSRNENEKLNALADELIASDTSNPFFVYLKGYIAHQKQDTDAAIEWYEKTLEVDPNYESALNNLSRCYLYKAQDYATAQSSTKVTDKKKLAKDKEILDGYYKKALPLLEKLRQLQPDKHELWLANLTNCYYNLNMTAELKEIEKLQESLGY